MNPGGRLRHLNSHPKPDKDNKDKKDKKDGKSGEEKLANSDIQVVGRQSAAEKKALLNVLDKMELDISVFKKEGAKKVPIRKTQTIRDLKKYKKINSHGLEEI